MSLGAETQVVNGQMISMPQQYQYNPPGYGPTNIGIPIVSPSYPPFMGGGAMTTATPGSESVGGYGTAGNNGVVAAVARAAPFAFRTSPLPWAIIGLLGSLVLLKTIHWRETVNRAEGVPALGVKEEGEAEA